MQILLLQNAPDGLDHFVFILESTLAATVHFATSAAHGIEILQRKSPTIDLVILDSTAHQFEGFDKLVAEASKTPCLYCGDPKEEKPSFTGRAFRFVDRSILAENAVSAINSLISEGLLQKEQMEEPHCRIPTKLLLSVVPLKGDVYIRLSPNKFVKLFHEGDVFDQSDLEKYTIKKGIDYLYIRREQCKEFAQKFLLQLEKILKSGKLKSVDAAKLGVSVHETVHELIKNIGFKQEVQDVVKTQIEITLKSLGKEPGLADFVKKFQTFEGQYIASHSMICAYLACCMAVQLEWGSNLTFKKLSLAAFMHDITLSNNELAELRTLADLEANKSKFTDAEKKEYRDHPIKVAEMIRKASEIPPDVDTIIRQHHERPDASGFPGGLDHSHIAPLASLFVVSHDLADYVLKSGQDFNLEVFLQGIREQYQSSYFKKILASLEVLRKF